MNTYMKGLSYELFVRNVYQAILKAEQAGAVNNIDVKQNVIIADKFGLKRQIDVYWEYSIAGVVFSVGIECKNYQSKISIEKVDAFVTKIESLNLSKGIIVTANGFQSGAVNVAKQNGVSLIVLREIDDRDLEGRIKEIVVNLNLLLPPRITDIQPEFNKAWVKNNYHNLQNNGVVEFRISGLNTEIFIVDKIKNETLSIYEMQNSLVHDETDPGEYEIKYNYEDAYLKTKDKEMPIRSLVVKYKVNKPICEVIKIDYRREFLAVMEYLTDERKKIGILRNGSQKEF